MSPFYDTLNYARHYFSEERSVWLWSKKYRRRNHYRDDEVGYGVTSPRWDHVFRMTAGVSASS